MFERTSITGTSKPNALSPADVVRSQPVSAPAFAGRDDPGRSLIGSGHGGEE